MQQSQLELKHLVPTVSSDGNVVLINDGGIPTLLFFQARQQNGDKIFADVVASVRIDSITELEKIRDSIDETIRNHKTREA